MAEDEKRKKKNSVSEPIFIHSTIIGILLLIFSTTKLPWVANNLSKLSAQTSDCQEICEFVNCFDVCDTQQQFIAAYSVMLTGLLLIIVFTIAGMSKPAVYWMECNNNKTICGLLVMIGLVIGGVCYMMGYWIIMDYLISFDLSDILFDDVFNWWIAVLFFEFYLGGAIPIIFGIDCYIKFMHKKQYRIHSILVQLVIVSLVCFIGYTNICIANNRNEQFDDIWKYTLIAIGYGLILVSCLSFIVCSFLKCGRIITAVIGVVLSVGGILTTIGYCAQFNRYDPYDHAFNSWNIAYCLLLIVSCLFIAMDMITHKETDYNYDSVPKYCCINRHGWLILTFLSFTYNKNTTLMMATPSNKSKGQNTDSFIWNIDDATTINNILHCKIGTEFKSPIIDLCGLQWQIEFCPNGTTMDSKGSCRMYIKLMQLPDTYQCITVRQTILCLQTFSSNTWVFTYNNAIDTPGWKSMCLLLDELKVLKPQRLRFRVKLQIQQIIDIKSKQITFHDVIAIKTPQSIEWKLDKRMINAFKDAHNGKLFESPIQTDDMFMITCYPQGLDARFNGKISLYLQLIHLPSPNITKMKVKYTLSIGGTKMKYTDTQRFSIDENHWGNAQFTNASMDKVLANVGGAKRGLLKKKKAVKAPLEDMMIMAKIEVLKVYDCDGNKLQQHQWNDVNRYDFVISNKLFNTSLDKSIGTIIASNKRISLDLEQSVSCLVDIVCDGNETKEDDGDDTDEGDQDERKVKEWIINQVKLKQYLNNFIGNGYDQMAVIQEMKDDELEAIGIHLMGHRKRFAIAIDALKKKSVIGDGTNLQIEGANVQITGGM